MPEFIRPNEPETKVTEEVAMTPEEFQALMGPPPNPLKMYAWAFVGFMLSWLIVGIAFLIMWNVGAEGVVEASGGHVSDIDFATALGLALICNIWRSTRG